MNLTFAYKQCADILLQAGIENSGFEAQCLVEHIFGVDRVHLIAYGNEGVDSSKVKQLFELAQRRINREPLQYILGQWSFMGFDFKVGAGVLIPRDDTEVVVNLCLDFLSCRQSKNVADLCAGSGAISIAIQKITNSTVTAVELDSTAFSYLEQNIKLNNSSVSAVQGDVFSCYKNFPDNEFDLIVSNPPYIISDEIQHLQAEVQKEPVIALDGGANGFDFYRSIIANWSKKLKAGGALAFELGENQAHTVKALMSANGFDDFKISLDFGGVQRAIIGTLRRDID